MIDQTAVVVIAQIGFPAAFALIIWRGYQELVRPIVKALEDSAAAQQRMALAIEANTRMGEHLADTITWLEKRFIQMESQHKDRDEPVVVTR